MYGFRAVPVLAAAPILQGDRKPTANPAQNLRKRLVKGWGAERVGTPAASGHVAADHGIPRAPLLRFRAAKGQRWGMPNGSPRRRSPQRLARDTGGRPSR